MFEDLISILQATKMNDVDIVNFIKDLLNDNELADKLKTWSEVHDICYRCGCDELTSKITYEYSDADGNRGRYITIAICNKCGDIIGD